MRQFRFSGSRFIVALALMASGAAAVSYLRDRELMIGNSDSHRWDCWWAPWWHMRRAGDRGDVP
jgi:hypothetical protein